MAVTITPTLAAMAEVYALPTTGGPRSARFWRYEAAGRAGAPVANYNPMTSKPVADTIARLLAIDAEAVAQRRAEEVARRLGWAEPLALHLVVAAPGMWTDRHATTVDAVLDPGRAGEILWWFDDEPDRDAVAGAAAASATRAIWWAARAAADVRTVPALAEVAAREGVAGFLAAQPGTSSTAAAEALEVLGDDEARSTAVAFLWGDGWAAALGHPTIGLGPLEGLSHVTALAAAAGDDAYRGFSIIPTR